MTRTDKKDQIKPEPQATNPSIQEMGGAVVGTVAGAKVGEEIGKVAGKTIGAATIPIPFIGEKVGEEVGKGIGIVAGATVGSKIGSLVGKSTVEPQPAKVTRDDLNSLEAYYKSHEYKKANPDITAGAIEGKVNTVIEYKRNHINRVRHDRGDSSVTVQTLNREHPQAEIKITSEDIKDIQVAKEWKKEVDKHRVSTPEQEASRSMGI
jgi:uncharacterized protein YcfJ